MKLDIEVETVPTGLEDYYKQDGDKFKLDVDIPSNKEEVTTLQSKLDAEKAKVAEFRTNNIDLKRKLDDVNVGDVNSDVNSLIEKALTPIKEKNEQLLSANTKLQATLEEVVLSDKVKELAIKHGVLETAVRDVVTRAKDSFVVKDGVPLPSNDQRDSEGKVLSLDSWITTLTTDAPHYFKQSSGSNPRGSQGASTGTNLTGTDKIKLGLSKL